MNIGRQPVIVVLGLLTTMPVGGVVWQTVHYLVGLRRLGFDVYYAEEHGIAPSMFTDDQDPDGTVKAAEFLATTLSRFDLSSRWSYHAWHHSNRYYGVGKRAIKQAFRQAAAVINLHGGTIPRAEYQAGGAFIYLETDPVAPQIELSQGLKATEEFLDAHTAYFTFGENLGAADCKVPLPPSRYRFYPTRQPVVLDFWRPLPSRLDANFTTIANWKQPQRQMSFKGETYGWSKHDEFLKFLDLPKRTGEGFELALSSFEGADREMLERRGWKVRPAMEFSGDASAYRQYIRHSRGEWTVAKDQNVRLRSGWFSDRAATYLASGRPVVTQETGFSNVLPTGRGLFAFTTVEEAVATVEKIVRNYREHSREARRVAREHFSSHVVLPKLLKQAGVSLPT